MLANELRELRASKVDPGRGGVSFQGDLPLLYRTNLYLRTAIRVLRPILEVSVATPEQLYEAVRTIDWARYLTPDHTLAVDANVRDSAITHSKYAALKVKDAICDQFVDKCGARPNVDVDEPMIGLNLHIHKNQAVLSLESSGESLHKRGYRPILTKAPLNEALAAGLILLTDWRGETPLVDPLCGSGTLCIEAAWIALNRPPGLTRRRFGFMGWMDFDVALWRDIRDQARREVRKQLAAPVFGSDIRRDAIEFARRNARAAGIGHLLRFELKDVRAFHPLAESPGVLICNPPYGERIGEEKELGALYRDMGRIFRERFVRWRVFVFTGNAFLARQLAIKPRSQIQLFNGKIPCRLLEFVV